MNDPVLVWTPASLGLRTCTGSPATPISTPSARARIVRVSRVAHRSIGALIARAIAVTDREIAPWSSVPERASEALHQP